MRIFYTCLALCFSTAVIAQVTCDDQFELVGTASLQGDCIQMTANTTSQQGCAWFPNLIDFTQPFTHTMRLNFGTTDFNGADGICMVYQTNGTSVCGIGGGGIASMGIPNSFIIEMDTWDNGVPNDDIPNDHIAIDVNGDHSMAIDGPFDLGNIEDGNDHELEFQWNPVGNMYEVYFDGNLVLSGSYDIVNLCFGGATMAYWGFTSSTGGSSNEHLICPEMPPEVIADAGPDLELPCPGSSLMLDGTASDSGSDFQYTWTTFNGNIVSGANTATPTVDEGGTYILTVLNTTTNCESVDEVTVGENQVVADVGIPPFLDCYSGVVILDGSNSTSGANITYDWSTSDGNIQSTSGSQATVDAPGNYTLTVTYDNGISTCVETASVDVMEDPNVPMAFAFDNFIQCDPPSVQLDGSLSSQGGLYSYQWTTSNGFIVSGSTTDSPTVGAPGVYTLVVTNTVSGCTDEYGVFVTADQDLPDAFANASEQLSCTQQQVTIDGSNSSDGPGFSYQWSTSNGNIVSGGDTHSPVVDMEGQYTLVVTDSSNGCSDQTTVTVSGAFDNPVASIAAPTELTCTTTSIMLDGSGSDQGPDYNYTWSTLDGQIDGAIDGLTAMVSAPGEYILSVSSTGSDCIGLDTVIVSELMVMPTAEAGTADEIGCGDTSVSLDGSGSSSTPAADYSYEWTTMDGNIIGGAASLTPTVNAPGIYQLEVTHITSGCTSTDIVEVQGDASTPIVQVDVTDGLDCTVAEVMLDASASSQGASFDFTWSTSDGNFTSGLNSLQPTVDQAGSYTLSITNLDNNCITTQTVDVLIDTIAPIATIELPAILNCNVSSTPLDAGLSSQGAEYSYQWSTVDGNLTGPTDAIVSAADAPGSYALQVTNTDNSCSSTATIMLVEDVAAPTIAIAEPDTLSCVTATIQIDAGASSQGANFDYQWTTADGQLQADSTSLMPIVDAPGTYDLLITNQDNFCTSTASIAVMEDITSPSAAAGIDLTLNCFAPTQSMGDAATSTGPNFSYTWMTANGQIDGAADEQTATAQAAGLYVLEVLNTQNGCLAMDSVQVNDDFAEPMASIAMPGFLTCTDSLVVLDATASSDSSLYSYAWSTVNGNVLAGGASLQPTVSQAGDYELLITNTENGCTASDIATVAQDENFPTAGIATPMLLTCEQTTVTLSANASSQSGNFDFAWSTTDGQFQSGDDSLTPTVDAPGTYLIQVTDLDNNCQALAAIEVQLDNMPPSLEVAQPDTLTCTQVSINLDATNSSQGMEITYLWSTADGQVLAGADGPDPSVGAPGIYDLLLTNMSNGCTSDTTVTVAEDVVVPMIDIAIPATLTCALTSTSLDASGSDNGPLFAFSWTSSDGEISSGADGFSPEIAAPGNYDLLLTNTNNGCTETASVQVQEDVAQPTVAAAVGEILTCAQTQTALSSMGSDAGAAFVYEWSTVDGNLLDPIDTPNPQVDQPGMYNLVILNQDNGCSDTAEVEVLQDIIEPSFTFDAVDELTCDVLMTSVAANAMMAGNNPSFAWSTVDGQIDTDPSLPQIDVSVPGNYAMLLTNEDNGCTAMATIAVVQDTISPVAAIAEPAVLTCAVQEFDLDASASTNTGNLLYTWTSPDGTILAGATGLSPTIGAPGGYELMIVNEDNGCADMAATQVQQDTVSPIVMITTPDTLDCQATTIGLDAAGSSSGATFTISWTTDVGEISSGANTLNPMIEAPGNYSLQITNEENGCSSDAAITVAQDDEVPVIAIADAEMLTCILQAMSLDAAGSSSGTQFMPNWTTFDGQIQEGANTLSPVITEPGTYTLTIINSDNLCEESAAITVLQDVVPPVANAGVDFTLPCFNPTTTLDGSQSSQGGQFAYQWSALNGTILQGDQGLSPSIDGAGSFELLITNNDNGCTASDQVEVDEDVPEATSSVVEPLCFGDPGTIVVEQAQGGTQPYVYSVNGGESFQTTPIFNALPAGVYDLVVQDVNGCEFIEELTLEQPDSLTVVITEPEVTIQLGESHAIFAQVNVPVDELVSITWEQDGSLDCDDCLTPIAKPDETSVYRVTVRNENGCSDQAILRLFVEKSRPVYIPTAFSPDGDGINDLFMVFARLGTVEEVESLEVFNRWGEGVFSVFNFQANDPTAGWDGVFRGRTLNPGVFAYVARVKFVDGETEVLKGEVILVR